jgi:SAM-dependent methyltransferase
VPDQIRFTDGVAYEQYMGRWSQLVGTAFLDWLAPAPGLRWLDVGCGNGVFTEMVARRCEPGSIAGIDPSEAQLSFARTRPALNRADLRQANAMALPFADGSFDVAVMPLVIFFVPDPAKGVAEMVRVVSPGGFVAAYGWDLVNGGFPYAALRDEMRASGVDVPLPPSPDAASLESLNTLWTVAGLSDVDAREREESGTLA